MRCTEAIAAKDSAPGGAVGMSSNRRRRLRPDGPALAGTCAVGDADVRAHRSWQLPGQFRAAIIMYAARNRIRRSPALLLVCAGPSLRRAVTAAFRGSIYYAGCGCHPLVCIACAAMSPAFVEAFMILRMFAMCARAVSRDAGCAVGSGRSAVRGGAAGRFSAGRGAADVSLRPAHKRNSPAKVIPPQKR